MNDRSGLFAFAASLARVQAAAFTPAPRITGIGGTPQSDLFDAKAERDRVLTNLRERRKVLLVALNGKLEEVARARPSGLVSADDAHRIVADWPEAAGLDPRWTGAVWRSGPWQKTEFYVPSLRRACHARPIPLWRLDA